MRIIYFSACAIINLVALLFTIYVRHFTHGTQNRAFLVLVWVVLISGICDFTCTLLQVYIPITHVTYIIRYISTVIYFVTRSMTSLAFIYYILVLTFTTYKLKSHKFLLIALFLPFTAVMATIIANFFTNCLFYFDAENNFAYKRGPFAWVNYVCAFLYMLVIIYLLIKYRKMCTIPKLAALHSLYILSLIAVVIQLFKPNWLIEIFLTSISVVTTMILVQRPEEYSDAVLGILNYIGFKSDIKNYFISKHPTEVVVLKFKNYENFNAVLSYENKTKVLLQVSSNIKAILHKMHIQARVYNIDNGRFAVIPTENYSFKSMMLAQNILENLDTQVNCNSFKTELDLSVCVISIFRTEICDDGKIVTVSDVDNFDEFMILAEQFYLMSKDDTKIITLQDEKTKLYYEQFITIDRIISNALENNKFEMYYQPIFSVKENRIIAAEALIRLKDEKWGFISPEVFIPASENNGSIIQIGDFVLDTVCAFTASDDFKKLGLDYIELNLSVCQCMQPDLAEKVDFFAKKHNVSPKKINLEITESAVDKTESTMLKNIQRLSEMGYSFSLDDYGTGYSNILRLATLPLKIIKFDKTFVHSVKIPKMQIILKKNIEMIKEMQMEIVVEGIETPDMLKIFSDYNCDFIQGYYFSRPIPVKDFCAWVEKFGKTDSTYAHN